MHLINIVATRSTYVTIHWTGLVNFELAGSDKQGMKEVRMRAKQYFHAKLVHFGICKTTEELIHDKYEKWESASFLSCVSYSRWCEKDRGKGGELLWREDPMKRHARGDGEEDELARTGTSFMVLGPRHMSSSVGMHAPTRAHKWTILMNSRSYMSSVIKLWTSWRPVRPSPIKIAWIPSTQ